MAISEAYSGTASISTTEFSCPNNSTTLTPVTADGVYQMFLDTSDMVEGDQLQIRIYEKCRSADTQLIIYEAVLTDTMAATWVSPSLILLHGWDLTLDALAGTITVNWSIRQVA